jgi:hypothetical protein
MMRVVSARLGDDMVARLDYEAARNGLSREELVQRILTAWVQEAMFDAASA